MTEIDMPSDTLKAGVDNEGRTHWYSSRENTVYVAGEKFELDETRLHRIGDWVEFVTKQCGWEECRYHETLAGALEGGITVKKHKKVQL